VSLSERAERRLVAILAADVVGYSRLMAADEAGTLAALTAHRKQFIEPKIAEHHGRIVKLMGDGVLVEFGSVVEAVRCGVELQEGMAEHARDVPQERQIRFRIGINLGDIIIEDDDIHGDGVNVAARLEALAEPGGICVSRTVRNHVQDKLALAFEDLGERTLKNIPRPVRVFRVVPEGAAVARGSRPRLVDTRWMWAAAAAVVLLVAAGGAGLWLRSDDGTTSAPEQTVTSVTASNARAVAQQASLDKYRIAVLPFTNISADPEDEYFADGMTEELISKLSRLHDLTVIARTSVMQYRETGKSVAEIGQELRVGTILEGSVRKAGDRLRITAQLIDVVSQGHLWSEDYDRELTDVFAVQSDVAQSVAGALRVRLRPGERESFAKQGTENLKAYNLYLKGLYHWNKLTNENLEKAKRYFEEAIDLDPTYAQAYAWLAFSYQVLGEFGHMPANDAYPKAKEMALKAIDIDPMTPEAYSVLGTIFAYYDWNWTDSEAAYKKAIEIKPNSVVAHWNYGILLLSPLLRHEEAIAELKLALELEPLAPWIGADLAWAFNGAKRFDDAIATSQSVIDLDPGFPHSHASLGYAYLQTGRYEEAFAELRREVELTGQDPFAMARLGWAYGMAGEKGKAQDVLAQLERRAEQEHIDPLAFAWVASGLNDKDAAFTWLEQAYEERSSWLIFINATDYLAPLRSDPRLGVLLRRMGLEPD
jgi:class 3 adenylate cyclase/TolB-like protein/Flp pilus assembly protein TadD